MKAPFRAVGQLLTLPTLGFLLLGGCGKNSTTSTPPVCGGVGTVCTVLGNGTLGWAGEGEVPGRVSMYWPIDATFDADGRLVVLDWNNQRVRRIDADGRVRTIVGTGFEDTILAQGTPALETSLHHAYSMGYDAAGNLYLAGFHVPWVLRVTPDMLVWVHAGTTVPGYSGDEGPALDARLGIPTGVAAAAAGAPLYISDSDGHCIRVVDAGGIIHTLAGDGTPGYSGDDGPAASCRLKSPHRVRYDQASGAVIVCDTGNHAIRRIDAEGTITTVAGTGTPGFGGDGGPATAASLNTPLDALIGPDGLVYVADTENHRVRRVEANGTMVTLAGTGSRGYAGDGGSALAARFDQPTALAFDATGDLYVVDTNNGVVRKIVLVEP